MFCRSFHNASKNNAIIISQIGAFVTIFLTFWKISSNLTSLGSVFGQHYKNARICAEAQDCVFLLTLPAFDDIIVPKKR